MKFLSIVSAMLLIADINLVYSDDVINTIKKDETCTLVCTRPETSLNSDKCMCVSDKNTVSDQDGTKSLHYIGSKINKNGSEITIYKDKNGYFIAIYPDREPPNHYKKSKTLRGVLGLEKIDEKLDMIDPQGGADHKPHKNTSKQTPNNKMKSVVAAGIDKKEGGVTELHGGVDHKPHKRTAKQTPNIKTKSVVAAGIDKKEGGATELHGGVDHKPHKRTAKQTPNIKTKSGSAIELVKNADGTNKVYATITKRGTKEKVKVHKAIANNDWVIYSQDGVPVRYGSNKSLGDIFKAENHEGPISARDKYRIELDKWKREEAYRKKLEVAEEAARNGIVGGKSHKRTAKQTPNIKTKSGSAIELVKNADGTNKVYATITKRGTKEKVKVHKAIANNDWVIYSQDGVPVRYGSNKSLGDIFKAENHEGPISARDKYRIELDKWKREEAYRKKLEVAEKVAQETAKR